MNFTEHESAEEFIHQLRREHRTDQITGVVVALILFGAIAYGIISELNRWLE